MNLLGLRPILGYAVVVAQRKRTRLSIRFYCRCEQKNWDEWLSVIDGNIFALITVYMLDANGYLEHGTSIRHPWLTSKGEKLIEALDILKEYSYDFGEAENMIHIDSVDE